MGKAMKEGVCVFEPTEHGDAYNTYPIDGGLAALAAFYDFINQLRERGFVERHDGYLRWYSPQAIQSVTWKIPEGGLTGKSGGVLLELVRQSNIMHERALGA